MGSARFVIQRKKDKKGRATNTYIHHQSTMLSKRSHRISTSTLNFVTRFIWNDHKPSKRPENEALADALNLLTKPTTQSTYKPSLFKSLTEGSVDEQLSKAPPKVHIKHEPHISEHFVNNLLWGIKSSLLDSQINHSQLLNDMSAEELSSYTKRVKNMASLREIVQLFYNHDRLTPRILTDVLLNKSLKSLDNFPIDLNKFEGIKGVDNRAVLHLKIIMLKKYYDLNQPLDIIRNLKSNFAASYLPLIESHQLTPFYERIVWRFVFEYLRQYNEEYYIKSLKSLQSSFLIWESSSYTANQSIAQLILENHGELTKLQVLFLKIASSARTFDVPKLRKISIKYKLHKLKQQEDRKLLYAVLNELENLLIASQPNNTKSLLEELALYRLELVQDVYNRPVEPLESLEWSKA